MTPFIKIVIVLPFSIEAKNPAQKENSMIPFILAAILLPAAFEKQLFPLLRKYGAKATIFLAHPPRRKRERTP